MIFWWLNVGVKGICFFFQTVALFESTSTNFKSICNNHCKRYEYVQEICGMKNFMDDTMTKIVMSRARKRKRAWCERGSVPPWWELGTLIPAGRWPLETALASTAAAAARRAAPAARTAATGRAAARARRPRRQPAGGGGCDHDDGAARLELADAAQAGRGRLDDHDGRGPYHRRYQRCGESRGPHQSDDVWRWSRRRQKTVAMEFSYNLFVIYTGVCSPLLLVSGRQISRRLTCEAS